MVFYFLISIVFISEIIITLFILGYTIKLDKKINEYNTLIDELKPTIKEILGTFENLSQELLKLAPIVTNKIKSYVKEFLMGQLKNAVGALTFWLVKKEVEKRKI